MQPLEIGFLTYWTNIMNIFRLGRLLTGTRVESRTLTASRARLRAGRGMTVTTGVLMWLGSLTGALAGVATYSFDSNPTTIPGFVIGGNNATPWQAAGGNPGGFLALTYATGNQFTSVVLPELDAGKAVAGFEFTCDVRTGNSSGDRPADGFSISFAPLMDPAVTDPGTQASFVAGFPESGTTTGITISFDAWVGNPLPDGNDLIGILVRVDNRTIHRVPLPTLHGACGDATSLRTPDLAW